MMAIDVSRLVLQKNNWLHGLHKNIKYMIGIEKLWANFGLPYLECLALDSKWGMVIIKKQMHKLYKRLIVP
jgi:hypothetical protein